MISAAAQIQVHSVLHASCLYCIFHMHMYSISINNKLFHALQSLVLVMDRKLLQVHSQLLLKLEAIFHGMANAQAKLLINV